MHCTKCEWVCVNLPPDKISPLPPPINLDWRHCVLAHIRLSSDRWRRLSPSRGRENATAVDQIGHRSRSTTKNKPPANTQASFVVALDFRVELVVSRCCTSFLLVLGVHWMFLYCTVSNSCIQVLHPPLNPFLPSFLSPYFLLVFVEYDDVLASSFVVVVVSGCSMSFLLVLGTPRMFLYCTISNSCTQVQHWPVNPFLIFSVRRIWWCSSIPPSLSCWTSLLAVPGWPSPPRRRCRQITSANVCRNWELIVQ